MPWSRCRQSRPKCCELDIDVRMYPRCLQRLPKQHCAPNTVSQQSKWSNPNRTSGRDRWTVFSSTKRCASTLCPPFLSHPGNLC